MFFENIKGGGYPVNCIKLSQTKKHTPLPDHLAVPLDLVFIKHYQPAHINDEYPETDDFQTKHYKEPFTANNQSRIENILPLEEDDFQELFDKVNTPIYENNKNKPSKKLNTKQNKKIFPKQIPKIKRKTQKNTKHYKH